MAEVKDEQNAPELIAAHEEHTPAGEAARLSGVADAVKEEGARGEVVKAEPPARLLRQTTFWLVWAGQSVSVLGDAIYGIALIFWISTLPGGVAQNAAALAGFGLVGSIPRLTLGPLMAGLIDRLSRKWIMLTADLLRGGVITLISLLLVAGQLQLWQVYVAAFVDTLCTTLHEPSFEASIANLVPKSLLTRANGLVQSSFSAANILGPALGGTLIALLGLPLVVEVNAISFFVAAGTMFFAVIPQQREISEKLTSFGEYWGRTLHDAAFGFKFIRANPTLLYLLSMFTSANFWGGPVATLTPLLILDTLKGNASTLGIVNSVEAAGFLVGATLIGAGLLKFRKHYQGVAVGIGLGGFGALLVGVFAALRFTPGVVAAGFLDAAAIPVANTNSTAIWQLKTPDEARGRVFAARRTIAQATFPISVALSAPAAAFFGVVNVVIFCGAMGLLTGIVGLFLKPLRTLED